MTIVGRDFLITISGIGGTVYVQKDLFDRLAVMNFIHPLTRLVLRALGFVVV